MRLCSLILLGAMVAMAQDPPSRVARLAYLSGAVSFQPATVDDWSAATLNYPLTTGDHLYADQDGSAEIGIGPNHIRMAHMTNFGFLNLDDRTVQIRLTEGSLNIRVRALDDQDVWEIDTPNGAVTLLRTGEYRIDTDPARNTTLVTVRGGDAEVTANGQSFPVHPRQTGYFTGDGQLQNMQEANPPDDFDHFAEGRDQQENTAPPPQYVSQNMVGAEDLNQYGTWQPQSEYGPIWRPRVAPGWAPYHDGRWVWREPWGWTWVDEAPWGFAPFHYGRWAFVGGSWGWCPGAIVVARPVYAPALVAFVGGGIGVGVGVGWFALGPREIYAPSYRVSPGYVRRVNVTNVREIDNVTINNIVVNRTVNNVYVNRGVPGAVTAVSRQDFVSAHSVQRSGRIDAEQFRSGPVAGFSPGIAPQRESVFGRAAGNVPRPQAAVFNRQVVARSPLPPAQVPSNSGFRGNQPAPQQPAVRFSNQRNEAFGRNTTAPQQVAPPSPVAVPQNRDQNRPPDRFQARPPQSNPQTAPQENRQFGRTPSSPQQQAAPQSTPQTAPQENRQFGRTPSSPQQQAAPQSTPQTAPQENRQFGRTPSSPQQQAAPQSTPQTAPQENRQFGRTPSSPQQQAPAVENRAPIRQDRPAVTPRAEQRVEPRVEQRRPDKPASEKAADKLKEEHKKEEKKT